MTELLSPRILIVTPHYPPASLSGAQLHTRRVALWMRSHGIHSEVVCVERVERGAVDQVVVEQDLFEDVPVYRLYVTHCAEVYRDFEDNPGLEAAIDRLVCERRPDLIHLISGYLLGRHALQSAYRQGIPAVVTLTDYWFVCPRINLIRSTGEMCRGPESALDCARCLLGERRRFRLWEEVAPRMTQRVWQGLGQSQVLQSHIPLAQAMEKRQETLIGLLNQADAVTIPTNSLRPRLVRAGVEDRMLLSRHGISAREAGIGEFNIKAESPLFRFGYMGQIIAVKGVDLLVEAYRQVRAAHEAISLSLWGNADPQPKYVARLQKLIEEVPGVTLQGRYEPGQIGRVLQEIDMLVVPSRWPEIGPLVILEAFAAQTPVIAANIGNMPELVEHGVNGLLFEPDSLTDLAAQMRRVVEEPGLYAHLVANVPAVRTPDDEMAEMAAIYRSVLAQRQKESAAYAELRG